MAFHAVVLTVRRGDTDVLRPDRAAVTFNNNVDFLSPKAGNRESGVDLSLRGKRDPVRAVILGAVDDRVKARKGRCQILGTGDGFKLTSRAVCKEAQLLFAVDGSPLDVQQDAVDRDALPLRDIQRFLSGGGGALRQNLNRLVGGKVGHAVREQKDRARKPVFLAHAREHFRSPEHGGADVGIVTGAKGLHSLDKGFFIGHAVDGLKAGIIAHRLVKGNQPHMVALLGQKTEKESERVETQTIRVRSHAVDVAKTSAFVHDQYHIIAVCQGEVLLCVSRPRPAAHQGEGKDKSKKGRKDFLDSFHHMP